MLTIYYDREHIDKEAFLFEQIGAGIRRFRSEKAAGRRILLIVPDQYTLQAEQNALQYLQHAGFLEFEVVSLSRLRQRVLRETGGSRRRHMNKNGRHILLAQILREQEQALQVFAGQAGNSGFIELMNDLLSELKQHNTTPLMIEEAMREAETPLLRRKLKDIHTIFSCYEEKIRERYLDSEDWLALFAAAVPRSKLIRDSEIWMYGYDWMTPKTLDIVTALLKTAASVGVVLTANKGGEMRGRDRDDELFRITSDLAFRLQKKAAEAGVTCRTCCISEEVAAGRLIRKKAPALMHLERELFSYPFIRFEKESREITLLAAANYYAEAESAAAEIVRLVREEGLRYRDILVICNDMEVRASVLKRVFAEYDLPIFLDRRRNLLHNPVLEYITALLDMVTNRWQFETVFSLLKTGLTPVDRSDCELLEEYAAEHRVKGSRKWQQPFTKLNPRHAGSMALSQAEETAFLEHVNSAREQVVGHIRAFSRALSGSKSARERTLAVYEFLKRDAQIPRQTEELARQLQENGNFESADEMGQIWAAVLNVLEQLITILGDAEIPTADYARLMEAGLTSIDIGMIPTTVDQIVIGTMQRTRSGDVKAIFLIGANDGVLPASRAGEGVLNETEKSLLSKTKNLCRLDSLQTEEEQLSIYRNLAKAETHLWISYAVSDPDGNELRPSLILDKIRRIYPQLSVRKDILNESDGRAEPLIQCTAGAGRHLTEALRNMADGIQIDPAWVHALDWFRLQQPQQAARLEAGLFYQNRRERAEQKKVRELYGRSRGRLTISPSALEKYARCPFSHFVAYGLRPRERRIWEAGARERGDLFHRIIMDYSRSLTAPEKSIYREDSDWMRLNREASDRLVETVLRQFMESKDSRDAKLADTFRQGRPEAYRLERIRETAKKVAWAVASQVQAGMIEEMYFEERFGSGKKFPPIVERFDDFEVHIEGQIDRIDVLPGKRVKIIDYKSGSDRFDGEEVANGWRLQLMLYLRAVSGKADQWQKPNPPDAGKTASAGTANQEEGESGYRPAGVFYFAVDDPQTDCSGWSEKDVEKLEERAEEERRKYFRLDGVVVDDQEVLKAIAGTEYDGAHYNRGNSDILSVRTGKDEESGELILIKNSPRSKRVLDEESFASLQRAVEEKVHAYCRNFADGVIDVAPKKSKGQSACDYCQYRGICNYDVAFSSED